MGFGAMDDMGRGVWLSWHDGTRTRGLAERLGVRLEVFSRFRSGFLRHLVGGLWTLDRLLRIQPHVIYLQNSFLLLLICAIYKMLRLTHPARIIVDCHNKSLKRSLAGPFGPLFWRLKRWSFARADLLVVSNAMLVLHAMRLCPRVTCLRDPLPEWEGAVSESQHVPITLELQGCSYVLFVCSFEPDEPSELVFETAVKLSKEYRMRTVITGDSRRLAIERGLRASMHIFLPGFVSSELYRILLVKASVVVVLTEDQDCLVCGAYEAMGAMRPLVLSDTPTLRDYFQQYAVLSVHEPAALVEAIQVAQQVSREELIRARQEFSKRFDQEWQAFLQIVGHPPRFPLDTL